jgi:hypothetical protein
MPWSMVTVVAPVTVQLKVVDCPEVILAGFMAKLEMAMDDEVTVEEDAQPGVMQTARIVIAVSASNLIFMMLLLYDLGG